MTIPKLIHQTWRTKDVPFDLYRKEWLDSWVQHHPGWDYRLWTDAELLELVKEHCPRYTGFFRDAPGIVKADFGRYCVLHAHGGMYADLDYECYKPLDALMRPVKAIFCWSSPREDCLNNAWMAGEKGCDLFRILFEEAARRWTAGGCGVEWATGPNMVTQRVLSNCSNGEVLIYPSFLLCPIDWALGHSIAAQTINADNMGTYRREAIESGAYAGTYWTHNWQQEDEYAARFTEIYENSHWRDGKCGHGSTVEYTREYVRFLEAFIRAHGVRSVLDIGCGDWSFSRNVDWCGAAYCGLDVNGLLVDHLARTYAGDGVEFACGNALNVTLNRADLVLCKDVLQHLPNEHAVRLLAKMKQSCRYALITNDLFDHPSCNRDMEIGDWRLFDPTKPPFNEDDFKPIFRFNEKTVFLYEAPRPRDPAGPCDPVE